MRRILFHELKLVQMLLAKAPTKPISVPTEVDRVIASKHAALKSPLVVNRSFTAIFSDDRCDSTANLSLVRCQMGLPETIGQELFLVKHADKQSLAFLEFASSPIAGIEVVAPFLHALCDRKEVREFSDSSSALLTDLQELLFRYKSANKPRLRQLRELRVLVVDDIVCFFLSTEGPPASDEPIECVSKAWEDKGAVQEVSWLNHAALEGWTALG